MSGSSIRIALVAIGVVAALIMATLGLASAASVTSGDAQSGWLQIIGRIGAESQDQGKMILASATLGWPRSGVRDRRTQKGSSGDWTKTTPTPPPTSSGKGQGGIDGNQRDHRTKFR